MRNMYIILLCFKGRFFSLGIVTCSTVDNEIHPSSLGLSSNGKIAFLYACKEFLIIINVQRGGGRVTSSCKRTIIKSHLKNPKRNLLAVVLF